MFSSFQLGENGIATIYMTTLRVCVHCHSSNAERRCSKCHARYCSRECQQNDWTSNKHKAVCGALSQLPKWETQSLPQVVSMEEEESEEAAALAAQAFDLL